jgi:putative membrane protein
MSFLRADGKAALSRAIVAFEARPPPSSSSSSNPAPATTSTSHSLFGSLAALATLAFLLYGEPSFALHWFLIDPVLVGLAVGWLGLELGPARARS